MKSFEDTVISPKSTIREAMRELNTSSLRIVLVCNSDLKLLGTVTDGDIRRGLLGNCNMDDPVERVMNTLPKTVKGEYSRQQCLETMDAYDLLALPVIDNNGHLVGLETLHQALQPKRRDNPIFIMAGGFGTRLRPLTDNCPKPMLRVGDKPMLEHLINQFRVLGFHDFYISTHYMPEVIQEHFGDGSQWDISITYIHEETPLGTGGALGLLPKNLPQLPLIMMNGDVLTKIDFTELLDHHESHNLDATMCVRELEYKISYGVVESDAGLITNMVEKPTYRYHINTGIYVLSPECVASVQHNIQIDLPTLLKQRIDESKKVGIYTTHEYWLDIGQMTDYHKAQQDIKGFYQ